ncbi:MAG: hypothetical protein KAJ62_09450, partial [Desulfobacteraceae bacterium]|nr:hypothetical protein [Desulfobacteraceae bacterium]
MESDEDILHFIRRVEYIQYDPLKTTDPFNEQCAMFDLELMDKNNFKHHLFTVKAAGWLVDLGYDVEFEPEICVVDSGLPDLLISNSSWRLAVECKDIDTGEFFDLECKKKIADFVYDTVKTCDQIDLYLKEEVTFEEIQKLFLDPTVISTIYKAGCESPETRFSVSPQIE